MQRLILAAIIAGAASPVAAASLTSTATATSDYLLDGVSQTQDGAALQASLDAVWESGFYAGVWMSSLDFGPGDPAEAEVDFYGGYAHRLGNGITLDAGVTRYTYAGAPGGYDYTEFYFGLVFPNGIRVKAWRVDDDLLGGIWRAKGNHSIALGHDFSLELEATRVEYSNEGMSDFWHGQIGVSRPLGRFKAYLGYSDTSLDDAPRADGRLVFSLSTTFGLL